MEILTSVKRLYIRFKSLVNDFVYSFGPAALLLLVEVQNHTVPVRERGRIRVNVTELYMSPHKNASAVTEGLPIFKFGARRGWVINSMPWLLYSWKRVPVPIVEEAGQAPGLGSMNRKKRKSVVTIRFESWTIQPVASCYTDYAIPAPKIQIRVNEFCSGL